MGKELSLARSEDSEQPVLLANSGTGVPINAPARRNKGKKAPSAVSKEKGSKAKAPTAKSKIRAKVKDPDGGSSKQRRSNRNDKNRKSDRGAEGEDTVPRRSAKELGVEWIGSYCPDGQPHHLVGSKISGGWAMFRCKNCLQHTLLPVDLRSATMLSALINQYGANTGYCKYLDRYRDAKVLIAKMQNLWRASQQTTDNTELVKLIMSVMNDKEYDRKEVQWI